MSDDKATAQPEGAGKPEPEQGGAPAEPRVFTQDELNRINAQERRKAERAEAEVNKLKLQLDDMQKAQLTEAERAQRDAYERGKSEKESELLGVIKQKEIGMAVREALLVNGYRPEMFDHVMAHGGIEEAADAAGVVLEMLAGKPWAKVQGEPLPASGQPGAPSDRAVAKPYTGEDIKRLFESGEYDKHREQILAQVSRKPAG